MNPTDFADSLYYWDVLFNFIRCVFIATSDFFLGVKFKIIFFPLLFVYVMFVFFYKKEQDTAMLMATLGVFGATFIHIYLLAKMTIASAAVSDTANLVTTIDSIFFVIQLCVDKAAAFYDQYMFLFTYILIPLVGGVCITFAALFSVIAVSQGLGFTIVAVADNDRRRQ